MTVNDAINLLSRNFSIDEAFLKAFIEVETGGQGFDPQTGKMIIQFEPAWFRKKEPYAPSGMWSLNGVERQKAEWDAFMDACNINEASAMESTSIGLGQILGLHYKRLGYKDVYGMWYEAENDIYHQVLQLCQFLTTDLSLMQAIARKDWHTIASIYNGKGYKELAIKLGREPYDISLKKAYEKYSK
jgi:Protein of unknown function (DUF3380).